MDYNSTDWRDILGIKVIALGTTLDYSIVLCRDTVPKFYAFLSSFLPPVSKKTIIPETCKGVIVALDSAKAPEALIPSPRFSLC
jgi:hypothetical protein